MSITKTLRELNWHKGRGEVTRIRYNEDRTGGTVYRRIMTTPSHGFTESRRFTIKGNVVKAFGGQTHVKIQGSSSSIFL